MIVEESKTRFVPLFKESDSPRKKDNETTVNEGMTSFVICPKNVTIYVLIKNVVIYVIMNDN